MYHTVQQLHRSFQPWKIYNQLSRTIERKRPFGLQSKSVAITTHLRLALKDRRIEVVIRKGFGGKKERENDGAKELGTTHTIPTPITEYGMRKEIRRWTLLETSRALYSCTPAAVPPARCGARDGERVARQRYDVRVTGL
ncbi:hypothetical protein RRG08_014861 [Elysia crispata]|uniref:Uncharacterized protein n=1 Tax=Elysia crispata TaxID=231223 RepID=A0AAE1APG6_9GAST|nr:hypothetical protein RRG08_014861 [Elysia crispata]